MPAPHPVEFRQRAVELARTGDKPVAALAKDLGISESCMRNWMAQADADDLGSVGYIASDGVLELSVFKVRGAIPERVQTTLATRSGSETKGQVRGPDE